MTLKLASAARYRFGYLASCTERDGMECGRNMAIKKMMMALGCAVIVAIAGCDDANNSAESIGIIGGDDGPTATWMTTRLPWSKD